MPKQDQEVPQEWSYSILNVCSAGCCPIVLCSIGCDCWNYSDAMVTMDKNRDFCDEFVRALICCCWLQRGEMREKYNIEGSCATDCCVTVCCYPCAGIQMLAEAKKRTGYQPIKDKSEADKINV